jgi:hypothetical protein
MQRLFWGKTFNATFIESLTAFTYQATQAWLESNFTHLGRRATLDLGQYLSD